ncbi:hypothetical protein GCM10025777_15740 [Membranihabitans marinus]
MRRNFLGGLFNYQPGDYDLQLSCKYSCIINTHITYMLISNMSGVFSRFSNNLSNTSVTYLSKFLVKKTTNYWLVNNRNDNCSAVDVDGYISSVQRNLEGDYVNKFESTTSIVEQSRFNILNSQNQSHFVINSNGLMGPLIWSLHGLIGKFEWFNSKMIVIE